jgi:hypothetical protein
MLPAILGAASVGLGVAGMMRKQPNYGYSKGDLDYIAAQRAGQIDAFAKQLSEARARYATQLNQFGNNTFNRFTPQAESSFAGRGLSVTGGAFQSALARKAAEIQDNEMLNLFNVEHGDIKSVDDARGNLAGAQLGRGPSGPSPDPIAQGLGQLSGGLGSLAIDSYRQGGWGSGWPFGGGTATPRPNTAMNYGQFAGIPQSAHARSVFSNPSKMNLGY